MDILTKCIKIIDVNIITCLVPIIITFLVIEGFYPNRFETKKALKITCNFLIIFTIINSIIFGIGFFDQPKRYAIYNRSTGPYAFAYWLMLSTTIIAPLTLFIRKLSSKFWYVILVAFSLKIGFFFERFVIILTSFHRDNLITNNNYILEYLVLPIGLICIQGILIALTFLCILEVFKHYLSKRNI